MVSDGTPDEIITLPGQRDATLGIDEGAKEPAPAVPPVLGGIARAPVAVQAGTPFNRRAAMCCSSSCRGNHRPDPHVRQGRGKRIPARGDRTSLPDAPAAYPILYMLV